MKGMGKWKKGKWVGPPRSLLEGRFKLWCECLAQGTDIGEQGAKTKQDIKVQAAHFQNTFIYATRPHGVGGNKPKLATTHYEPNQKPNAPLEPTQLWHADPSKETFVQLSVLL